MTAGKVHLRQLIAHRWTGPSLIALALTGALGASLPAQAAVPTDWKNTPYAYDAQSTPLAKVLGDFANTFAVQLVIDGTVKGTVDGRMRAESPQAFLDRLGLEKSLPVVHVRQHLVRQPLAEPRLHAPGSIRRCRPGHEAGLDRHRPAGSAFRLG
nr:hypothetical protein GCM10020185_37840 [Pseudomonas brassicacearum subsp. brassicacearum]